MAERKVYKHYKPEWEQVPPPPASFRSILKWGDPNEFKEPNERLFTFMKQELGLTDADFQRKGAEGHEAVPETLATPPLELEHVAFFESVCGKENVSTKGYNRLSVAYGKTMYDLYRLRENITENVPRTNGKKAALPTRICGNRCRTTASSSIRWNAPLHGR